MKTNSIHHHEELFITACIDSLLNEPFWREDSQGRIEKLDHDSRLVYLSKTLPSLGFYNLSIDGVLIPVQICGNAVREISHSTIREFFIRVLNKIPKGNEILNQMTINHGHYFDEKVLTSLHICEDSPVTDSRRHAYRFYKNGVVKIRSDSDKPEFLKYDQLDGLVWSDQIINRNFDPDSLDSFDEEGFLSDLTDQPGHHFHKWCQNLCKSQSHNSLWNYEINRFKALASGFGYLLHRHWSDYKCVIFIDEDISPGASNGRTGKSVVLNDALSHALNSHTIDAKTLNKKSANNQQFTFNFLTPSTQYICFDDACEKFGFSFLFSIITGPLTVNKKYGGMFQFPKDKKPKMSITSNHPISGKGSSYKDRQHLVSIGGFYRYHKMELGKSPDKFHGGFLFDEDWGDKNWQEFDLFCVQSLHYYLKHGLINTGTGERYRLNQLELEIGSGHLVASLHRLLEENMDNEIYTHSVDGMTDDQVSRCLCDFVTAEIPDKIFTQHQLTKALKLVADHFGFRLNDGIDNYRHQKRFGSDRKAVDCYQITSKEKPFGSASKHHANKPITEEVCQYEYPAMLASK